MRYWGVESFEEYFHAADLWPVNPEGNVVLIGLIEDREGFENIEEIVQTPGLGGVLFGIGDGAVSLGSREINPDMPALVEYRKRFVAACQDAGVPAGFAGAPNDDYVQLLIDEGFRFFQGGPERPAAFPVVEQVTTGVGASEDQ